MRVWPVVAILVGTGATAAADTLVLQLHGIRENIGTVRVAICDKSLDETGCPRGRNLPASGESLQVEFDELSPGAYAVAVYQDLNENGELDKTIIGLPEEPYGFSNDIGRTGPPRFSQALVQVLGRTQIEIEVRPFFTKAAGERE